MKVTKSLYEIEGRHYRGLDGHQVKVPWRYGKPILRKNINEIKTIFDYVEGDSVECTIQEKIWNGEKFKVLNSIITKNEGSVVTHGRTHTNNT